MSRSKTKKETRAGKKKGSAQAGKLKAELWGLGLVTVGLCFFLSLISFSRATRPGDDGVTNLIGPVGAELADVALSNLGLCAFFLNAVIFLCGFSLLFGRQLKLTLMEGTGYVFAVPSAAVVFHLLFDGDTVLSHKAGGAVGELGAEIGRSLVGSVGIFIVSISTLFFCVVLIFETNPSTMVRKLVAGLLRLLRAGYRLLRRAVAVLAQLIRRLLTQFGRWVREVVTHRGQQRPAQRVEPLPDGPEKSAAKSTAEPVRTKASKSSATADAGANNGKKIRIRAARRPSRATEDQLTIDLRPVDGTGFAIPGTDLLTAPGTEESAVDQERLTGQAECLEKALDEFRIKGEVTGITPGPVVTMFEYEPAPGVKLSSISNLSADLARVIKAESVRIVAPIPGRGVVGLEVPNETRDIVYLREILESTTFRQTRAKLPLVIGKDISGNAVVSDLAKMPHLLVAGATGSGKSVAINAMVTSLLYRATPEEVRLILVDPKMLELNIYEGIPHLLVPVVTDPMKAATALKWAVNEMERRYHLLSAMKVRNIVGFNKEVDRHLKQGITPPEVDKDGEERVPLERMPYVVVVIDEFADLMMVASKDVETCVARLAQKARAAGIHLILATQRPSVDVITGLIKANFPTRISFRVFSRVDSRTVLDTQGAESLLGMGDMLFRPPGRGDLIRCHGAYVDEKEIVRVVAFLKEQGEPSYQEEILVADADDNGRIEPDEVDEMYDRAVELVTSSRKASISMVQRKLRVGYNRAARMIEMMERENIVGPSDGRGQREVIAPPPPPP